MMPEAPRAAEIEDEDKIILRLEGPESGLALRLGLRLGLGLDLCLKLVD